jgi:hypothetical protein
MDPGKSGQTAGNGRLAAPDGRQHAAIEGDEETGQRVVIRDRQGKVVLRAGAARSFPALVVRMCWTPDGSFLVWNAIATAGHQPWHHPIFVWSRKSRTVRALEDHLPQPIDDPGFALAAPALITTKSFQLDLHRLGRR